MQRLTVFCDFDGPVVDVSDRYYSTYRLSLSTIKQRYSHLGRSLPIHPLTKDQFWALKQHRVSDVEIALRSGVPHDVTDPFLSCVRAMVNQADMLHKDRLQPRVKWALNGLSSHGVTLILVTLRCQKQAEEMLRAHDLLHLFTGIYGTRDEDAAYLNVSEWKTSLLRQAWREHLCTYGCPLRSWMIGDTEADVLAGQAVGMPTIAVTSGIRSESYLSRFEPTLVFDDLLSATCYLLHPWSQAVAVDSRHSSVTCSSA